MDMQFDGQQSDERMLTVITPHISRFIVSLIMSVFIYLFILEFLYYIVSFFPVLWLLLTGIISFVCTLVLIITIFWLWVTQRRNKTYITDRRIIRFDLVTPFFTNKRALFWNEVLKVKAYANNMIFRLMKVGVLQIEPVAAEQESIVIPDVYYHEDLANYIDKILFTFKNKPGDMKTIKPFIPLPKGHRD